MTRMIEARIAVLYPLDTSQLNGLGYRVVSDKIGADSLRDEKGELQGRQLQTGGEVTIQYLINREPADVTYVVCDVQPPDSYVGEKTVVIIQGERSSREPLETAQRTFVQTRMGERWELLHEAIVLGREAGLPVANVEAELRLLEESVLRFT